MENLYLSIKTEPRIIENRAPQTADIDLFANSTSTPSSSGTADIILKQLVGMGFNREVCEMAVAEGLVNGNQSLEQATRYCLDYKDSNLNHPRSLHCIS